METALSPLAGATVFLDRSLKAQAIESKSGAFTDEQAQAGRNRRIPAASLQLVDWNRVYLELLAYREQRGYPNLAFAPQDIRAVFESADPLCHELAAEDNLADPKRLADIAALTEAVLALAKKYVDRFYGLRQQRWANKRMRYSEVRDTDPNFQDYVVRVPRTGKADRDSATGNVQLLKDIKHLIEEGERIYQRETAELPNVHFDRHLYQPLLMQRYAKVRSKPPALNESERRFVDDLRRYCRQEKDGVLAGGALSGGARGARPSQERELFLLRNQGRGQGVGFFAQRGFYPDFILWVKDADIQRIVFVEPHGMLHAHAYAHDDKACLHETLAELEREMARTHTATGGDVRLDSYIISATSFEDLQPRYDDGNWDLQRFAAHHILFPVRDESYDYLARMLGASA